MDIINDQGRNLAPGINFTSIKDSTFRVTTQNKNSKTLDFFNELYTYPPKFKIKWNAIDELHEDLFMSYNYRVFEHSFPFIDILSDFFHTDVGGKIIEENYSKQTYIDGYYNKSSSTKFYTQETKALQKSLQSVPVYAIFNGSGEIILADSTDSFTNRNSTIKSLGYNFCGAFDQLDEQRSKLGLFFMSRRDAEIYLREVARADTESTKIFGLSIHCVGLDFAYRLTREYHPEVDFRFVPNLEEVKTLLASETSRSNLIFDDDQQQLRFRRRPVKIVPIIGTLSRWVTPFSSFLSKDEYFKGVPIYVVQVQDKPRSLFVEQYYKTLNVADSVYSFGLQCIDFLIGFGQNWIIQGSIQDGSKTSDVTNFVFFEKKAAVEFCKTQGRKIGRYKGSNSSNLDFIIRKPKIFVHNLEDFIELWEDVLSAPKHKILEVDNGTPKTKTIFHTKGTYFVPPNDVLDDLIIYKSGKASSSFSKLKKFFGYKYRRLIGFTEIFLNTN